MDIPSSDTPNCDESSCYTPSLCNDNREILFTAQDESTENIICLDSLKPEIKVIIYTGLILNQNI